ncbi:MAG: hypothetical protein AB2417_01830 [Clostridiaceae bacterium]
METISIALLCSVIGAVIVLITFSRNKDKDLKKNTKEETIMSTRIDYIAKGVDDIRLDMKELINLGLKSDDNKAVVGSRHIATNFNKRHD